MPPKIIYFSARQSARAIQACPRSKSLLVFGIKLTTILCKMTKCAGLFVKANVVRCSSGGQIDAKHNDIDSTVFPIFISR